LASVEAAVQQIVSTEKKVDVLLNCAGISSLPSRQLTAQNFEMQLGM
jgi:NAD(P)-dependent dehydrogenase (short-subunit alcohol dehydrogenase family)